MLYLRRVVGDSMLPGFLPGSLVLALRKRWQRPGRHMRIGDVVIIQHNGREQIKRIAKLAADGRVYVLGDNRELSTDSRHFGWLKASAVKGRVIWPRDRKD